MDLLGLRNPVIAGCCLSPSAPYPMILDLHRQVQASGGLTVLAHPHSTSDYDNLSNWPGAGLGRELPVLAALGGLDGLDIASYSNDPELDTDDWFDLLSSGLAVTPTAGTDALLCEYTERPPGGWRVYVRQDPPAPLSYDGWLDGLVAGRTFVSSSPLVEEFTVGGSTMGQTLEVPGDSLAAPVRLKVWCDVGLSRVALVADGVEVWSRPFSVGGRGLVPPPCTFDTTFALAIPRPAWVLLRVDGSSGVPNPAEGQAVAYTNAVRITTGGQPVRRPDALARMQARTNRFERLVRACTAWNESWQRDTVLARIAVAHQFYWTPTPESVLAAPPPAGAELPRVAPNPSRGIVRIEGPSRAAG